MVECPHTDRTPIIRTVLVRGRPLVVALVAVVALAVLSAADAAPLRMIGWAEGYDRIDGVQVHKTNFKRPKSLYMRALGVGPFLGFASVTCRSGGTRTLNLIPMRAGRFYRMPMPKRGRTCSLRATMSVGGRVGGHIVLQV